MTSTNPSSSPSDPSHASDAPTPSAPAAPAADAAAKAPGAEHSAGRPGHTHAAGHAAMIEGLSKDVKDDIFSGLTFASLGVRDSVLKSLDAMGFSKPTKIQAGLIPAVLAGKDVIGQAKTGTGKTAAFGLPVLCKLTKEQACGALILVPTRELCLQVAAELNELGQFTPIRAIAVYGGDRIQTQVDQLKKGPQIIVSTPGRLMDMVERGHISLKNVKFAILDEVDRMLDIGFRDDIRRIFGKCPPPGERQTVFVSATMTPEVERLARSHSKDAEKIVAVTAGALTTALVKQFYLPVQPWDKKKLLAHLLTHEEPAVTLVFCRMKRTVDDVCKYLQAKKLEVHAIHGDMYQRKRNKVIEQLQSGDLKVLIASDLASRGLDVEGISHVINYDLPDDPEVYVHRIGRTARIGREGVAWSFCTPEQGELLTSIEMLINTEIPKLEYPDFVPTPPPRGVPAGPGGGPEVKKPEPVNRIAATMAPPVPAASTVDPSKFPGGIVPSKLPAKRMFGRVKGR